MNSFNELWEMVKDECRSLVSESIYDVWFKDIELVSFDEEKVVLAVSGFKKKFVETRFIDKLKQAFYNIMGFDIDIEIIDSLDYSHAEPSSSEDESKATKDTFESFVVGPSNKFAHAAAIAVAANPGGAYNPLFIHGNSGLGKTHLLNAICHEIKRNNPNANIVYTRGEDFTNELVYYIAQKNMADFHDKYRNADVLLVDDVQFIAGKDSTQEEFFHTFNTLYESGKQVILSSDKPPKDIPLLEDRLKSRFEWGIIADISNPDYETRLAILRKKAQIDNIIIDDEILSAIATRIDSNIRELEGTLNKLIATASLTSNRQITMEMAEKAINDIVSQQEKVISATYIQETVGKYFNINPKDLKGSKRSNDITFPRQIAMYLCRNVANMSLPQIGKDFGKRDHTTVMHACNKIEKEIKTNSNTKLIVESVKNILLDMK